MSVAASKPALLVMAKWPEAGQVKTRLCPPLSPEEAAGLYEAMLADILEMGRSLEKLQLCLGFHPPEREEDFRLLGGEGILLVAQEGGGLAQRMGHCFQEVFQKGYAPVVMRNSDAPTLPREVIEEALAELSQGADAVFSPDASRGFGIMGLAHPVPALLEKPLESENSYEEIIARCEREGVKAESVAGWYDVDSPRDLLRLLSEFEAGKVPGRTRAFLTEQHSAADWKARLLTGP